MKLIDISLPMSSSTASWPGDVSFERIDTLSIDRGDTTNVGAMKCSLHMGSHLDAPYHFSSAAATIDQLSLDVFVGPCEVVDVRGIPVIRMQDLQRQMQGNTARLLLRTDGWAKRDQFPHSISVVAEDVPPFLHEQGVRLLGVDVPSVDAIDSKKLPIHHALHQNGIHILESLDLSQVVAGQYELIAVPLKIEGGDASPVRAILRVSDEG